MKQLQEMDLAKLLKHSLKPEEIGSADPATSSARVDELVRWFIRLTESNANPKWLYGHAMELAYIVAKARMGAIEQQPATPELVLLTDEQCERLSKNLPGTTPEGGKV